MALGEGEMLVVTAMCLVILARSDLKVPSRSTQTSLTIEVYASVLQ